MTRLAVLFFIALLIAPAVAHDYWLKPWKSGAELVYGHSDESEPYRKTVVKSMAAHSGAGKALAGDPTFFRDRYRLEIPGAAAYVATVDDGPWVKTVRGWKRGVRKDHSGVLTSTWDRYYAKLVRESSPVLGLPLEIVVEQTSGNPAGRVLWQGSPLPDAVLEVNHKKVGKTDSQGRFALEASGTGTLIVRVEHKVKGSAGVDWAKHVSTLTLLR